MIKLSENQKNLGVMKAGTTKSFTVTLTNNGDKTVNLKTVKVGCGSCTSASVATNRLKPNESTKLSIAYTPKATGTNVPKTVSVTFTEDGTPETVIFTFFATVV